MNLLQALANNPVLMIIAILLGIYLIVWIVIQVAIVVSPKARDYLSSFFPQWFGRNGRPFTTHEKIGACFQGIALVIIVLLLITW